MDIDTSVMPSHLRFPPEIWRNITQNFRCRKSPDELSYLWTTVRQVSKQFQEDVEDIFRSEHLPKTWLHIDNTPVVNNSLSVHKAYDFKVYDFKVKLCFDTIPSRYPGRAVFSSRLDTNNRGRRWDDIFRTLLARVGTGRLGDADSSISGSRMRLYESPPGLFVVQVRGSVYDCAIPSLNVNVDPLRHELSFEWRNLFHRFFGERKTVRAVLDGAPVDTKSCDPPNLQVSGPFSGDINQLNQISPELRALAQLDGQTHHRHMQISNQAAWRTRRLENPIQTWANTMGEHLGQSKPTLERCRLQRQADQEIDLDDEGCVNQARMDWETESNLAAESKGRAEWIPLARACDACRKMNVDCKRGEATYSGYRDCDSCTEASLLCCSFLARLNISRPHYVAPTALFINQTACPRNPRGNHALQDYQMQMMLLEQQNKKRLLRNRQHVDATGVPPGSRAQQDYQMQLMLLEQQNKKRLLSARQQVDATGASVRPPFQ